MGKISPHYKDNWLRCNQWLQENAPEHVIRCLWEMRGAMDIMGRELEWRRKNKLQKLKLYVYCLWIRLTKKYE